MKKKLLHVRNFLALIGRKILSLLNAAWVRASLLLLLAGLVFYNVDGVLFHHKTLTLDTAEQLVKLVLVTFFTASFVSVCYLAGEVLLGAMRLVQSWARGVRDLWVGCAPTSANPTTDNPESEEHDIAK